jgi:DNA (cytosine-5)-methyltransferase 1
VRSKHFKSADLLCGAGGSSTGTIQAVRLLGMNPILKGFNHWPKALQTHHLNHPEMPEPKCANIDEVNPREHYKPGELDFLWASPECRHYSNARGGRPINEQQRPTMWCVPRWLEAVAPRACLVENVPEFVKAGPRKNGEAFQSWFKACCALGYWGDYRVFRCADFGDPTTRRRLIVQFVKKGWGRITWPEPHHLDPEQGEVPEGFWPWKDAENHAIDWRLQGRWLDEMPGKPQFGGLPISPKTLARIYSGFEDHSGASFLIQKDSFGDGRTRSLRKPLHTVTAASRSEALVKPYIIQPGGPNRKALSVTKPMHTILPRDHPTLLEPYVVEFDQQSGKNGTRPVTKPLSTMTTKGRHSLVEPYVVQLRGTSAAQLKKSGRSLKRPLGTITAGGGHLGLVQPEPWLIHTAHGGGRSSRSVKRPLPTVAGNRGDMALLSAAVLPQGQGGVLRPVGRPLPTVHTSGAIALLEAYYVKYYGSGGAASLKKPLDTITTKDRFALVCPEVVIQGRRARVRFRWRMLQPHELAAGQGFPKDYRFAGNKSEQTKQIGNAVPPGLARSLVLALLTQKSDVRRWIRKFKEAA